MLATLSREINAVYLHYYNQWRKKRGKKEIDTAKGKVSITLISKVLLGTLGCSIAFDEYVHKALPKGIKRDISKEGANQLAEYYSCMFSCKMPILEEINGEYRYPEFKVLDMGLWQRGYEITEEEKKKNAQKSASK